ncbi:hypothetical protein AAK882_10195 [Carnobacteriaceae bacterium 52-44]
MKNIKLVIEENINRLRIENKSTVSDEGKLYPKTLSTEELSPYINQLEQISIDKDIKNVAITGPYGIGKSSVLETYFQSGDLKKKTIFVNLPDFWQVKTVNIDRDNTKNKLRNDEKKVTDNVAVDESILQHKILEQIIFGVDKNIPFITMRKSNTIPIHKVILFLILSFLVTPSIVSSLLRWDWTYTWFANLSLSEWIANLLGLFFISYLIWKTINLIKISEMSVKIFGQGIAFEEKEVLPFSRYSEDLINFFKYSNIEYIVIEDLDRYEYTGIYKELRDLNQLINRSLSSEKRVVFIYALRDTLIVEANEKSSVDTKAKFFDYIIPILSNTSFNNGFETLNDELKKIEISNNDVVTALNSLFEEKDLRLLGYYLNGHRVIKLITAETKQLLQRVLLSSNNDNSTIKNKLNHIGISAKEVLGSVIYKNFYPHEYEKSRNHETDIDKINSSLQTIVSKMNAESSIIKSKITELDDSIEVYRSDKDLTSEEFKKKILIDFLKSFKEKVVYFIVNNTWVDLNLEKLDSTYKIFINKLDEVNSENVTFYRNRTASSSYRIKTITKNNLKKGKYKFSYEKFENFETIDEQIKEWKQQKMKFEQRRVFLENQNDFSTIYTFLKEQNSEQDYTNIENQELEKIIRKISSDKLKDMLFLNGFVTLNFNNIISSFPNSKLNGNDREIVESATLGNTIRLNQTINNPKEVIRELNRVGISYSNIESYSIAEYLFKSKYKNSEAKLNLILQNWKVENHSTACYLAFDKENYNFLNHILSEWPNGLLNEENEITNLYSFFSMLVDEKIDIELTKQPYIRAINTKKASKILNQFVKKNKYLVKKLLQQLSGKIELSYISIFDYDILQMMINYDLFSTETQNIEQMVKANLSSVFNFGSLAIFLTEFNNTSLVSKTLNEDELYFLIEDINEKSEELLDNEESLESFLLFIDLLKKNMDDPSFLILEILKQVKLKDLELSLEEKQTLTETVEIHELIFGLDDENYDMIGTFSEVVEKNILKYSEKFIGWFEVVGVDMKIIILNEIFQQNDLPEKMLIEFISSGNTEDIPNLYDSNTPIGLKYILLKMYSKEYFFDENISNDTVTQISEYVLNNKIQDEQILINLIRRNSVSIEERAKFIYMLINDYKYSITKIAKNLSIENEIIVIMKKNKNVISSEIYSADIYALLRALEKMNLTHSLLKKNEKIHYRLKKISENYI